MTAAPRWNRLAHDERRGQILAVARRLFSARSYPEVSTEQIAAEAGVRRGLLHHYFGSKRDLFLEVVRDLLVHAAMPFDHGGVASIEDVVDRNVDRWLEFVERNAATWFAVIDAEGFGHDHELQELVASTRDATVERIITVLGITEPTAVLRAILRTYSGLAEEATREWLQRKTLNRRQVHTLLTSALVAVVRDTVPAVEAAESAGPTALPHLTQ